MLKKSSSILLVVISWLMLTATPVSAISLRDFYNNAPPPLEYLSPRSLSSLKLNPEENNDTTILKKLNECIGSKEYCYGSSQLTFPLFATDSLPKFLLLFFPLYLIVFSLNYMLEFSVGLTFRFSKHKHFPLIVLLMNLTTHPLLTLIMTIFAVAFINNYPAIIFLEFMIVLIEALIFGWWYNRNKPKNTPHFTLAQALGFSLAINLVSFLLGEIISLTAPLLTLVNPLLNHYMLSIIILAFIALYAWIFQPLHLKTHKYQLNREI